MRRISILNMGQRILVIFSLLALFLAILILSGYLFTHDPFQVTKKWEISNSPQIDDLYGSDIKNSEDSIYYNAGNSTFSLNKENGKINWEFKTGDQNCPSPTLYNDSIYIGSYDHHVYALDKVSGKVRWISNVGDIVPHTPLYQNGTLFVDSRNTSVGLNATTGQIIWNHPIGSSIMGSVVHDNILYFGTFANYFAARDLKNQTNIWKSTMEDFPSIPIYLDGQIIVSDHNKTVFAIDAKTGKKRWEYKTNGSASRIAAFSDSIYFGTHLGHFYKLNASTGELNWETSIINDWISIPPVINNNEIYIGNWNGDIFALDKNTGERKWTYKVKGEIMGAMALDNNILYVGTSKRKLYALELPV